MASTVLESLLYSGTFGDDRMRRVFSDEVYVERSGLPSDAVQPLDSVLLPDGSQAGVPMEFAGR